MAGNMSQRHLSRKRAAHLLIGALLTAGCGLLVFMGLILSWYPPWHDVEHFVKFVSHPITLLFLLGIGLFVRGIFMRDIPSHGFPVHTAEAAEVLPSGHRDVSDQAG